MSKKIVSVILSLCIIVCALPMNILAAPEQNETLTSNGGKTLLLQNDYISFYFYDLQYQTCTATVPRAIAKETGEVFTQDIQAPDCQLNVYTGGEIRRKSIRMSHCKRQSLCQKHRTEKIPQLRQNTTWKWF